MPGEDRREIGRLFDEVPALYDRVRPTYPDELFADLVAITGVHEGSRVIEVGCGTGQATRSLAALGVSLTAVEPGPDLAALARQRLAGFENVQIETSTFEDWNDQGRHFDILLAAASWHWVDPSIGWPKAHAILRSGGWMALIGNIVVRRPGEPEVYAETADLHERYFPGNPQWCHPPLEDDVRTTNEGWGEVEDPGSLFGPTIVRWYPVVQWFDGAGFADLLRSTSLYRRLDPEMRERLLDAIAERIRMQMGDRASRRYLVCASGRTALRLTIERRSRSRRYGARVAPKGVVVIGTFRVAEYFEGANHGAPVLCQWWSLGGRRSMTYGGRRTTTRFDGCRVSSPERSASSDRPRPAS